jgi:plasmid stability protein
MSHLTIRNLDPEVERSLLRLAAERGVSMEQEAHDRLAESVGRDRRRGASIYEELAKLRATPDRPFDQKSETDAMWDEGLR